MTVYELIKELTEFDADTEVEFKVNMDIDVDVEVNLDTEETLQTLNANIDEELTFDEIRNTKSYWQKEKAIINLTY